MKFFSRRGSIVAALATVVTLVAGMTVVGAAAAPDAVAAPAPAQGRPDGLVTADALPTVQVNGVVWAQLIVGDTVYVGGNFTSARPAGSAPGQNETPRSHLLAYDLESGELITSFAPQLNQQVRTLAASPDGSRLYVGGNFTTADGQPRYRIAAFNTGTGALLTSFNAGVDYYVSTIVATDTAVYAGGAFSAAGGNPRPRLAAFSASTGGLLNWAPTADGTVHAMVLADGKLIVGGAFATINGAAAPGTVALDLSSGASLPWAANTVVKNAGANSAILTLSTDGASVYGGGFKFGSGGNLEGVFKANAATGAIEWIEDCHGDTYGVYAATAGVYTVGHAHYCGNMMGWPQPAPWTFNRAVAFSKETTGTIAREPLGYANWKGSPAPSLLSWFPRLDVGTFTGKDQAAWSITGNDDYVLLGGEFPLVNGAAQQGLARFAVKPIAPATEGPRLSGALWVPTLSSRPRQRCGSPSPRTGTGTTVR